ncbi:MULTISPECIES: hypothetical protein [unclassified Thiocapsa]|uniref:hypothetical protein n=1 Tax=unclassified Thiocapsa TaxID=2641286 RepID=UPI0035B00FE6
MKQGIERLCILCILCGSTARSRMIVLRLRGRERLDGIQIAGVALAFAGLVGLLMPGLSAPPLGGALMMIGDG